MPRGSGNQNGGIIGKVNRTSFAGFTEIVTTKTASTPSAVTTQPGTRLIQATIVAGGGGGGSDRGGGGGAGGMICQEIPVSGGAALGAVVVGSGGAFGRYNVDTGDS